ncbi:MAG: MFS transporter [Vicinamibacteria bacterium]|nr:MFS transporter [Vicinamibacteria bacterium]
MDFTPLRRHRDYRLLYIAQSVSFLGTMMTYVALPYQMFQLTHSSLKVGLLGVAELVPLLMTAFVGGALADSVDRRRMVIVTDVLLAAGSLSLALLAWHGAPPVFSLYVLAGFMSGMNGLQRPSIDALMPRLLPREDLMAAAALSSFRGSFIMIVGPAIGGVLIASMGLAFTYAMDVLSYALALGCIVLIRRTGAPEEAERPTVESIREGFRYARSRQELVGTYVVDFVAMIFGMPMALFPALSEKLGGPGVLGILYASPAVGAFLASVTSRWTHRVKRHGLAVTIAASVWGVAIVVFGFCDSILPATVFLAFAGGADAISGIFRSTMWNQTIPDHLRGRLAGIEMVSYTSGPMLGHLEAGLAAAAFGVRASVVSGGVLCVLGVALCAVLLPRFISYDADEFRKAQVAR